MTSNDLILLDSILSKIAKRRSNSENKGNNIELFAIDQTLKERTPSTNTDENKNRGIINDLPKPTFIMEESK